MNVERAEPGTAAWAELAAPHLSRYLFAATMAKGCRVLDLGCGVGYGAAVLTMAGARVVHGIDADPATVQRARTEHGAPGITFSVEDCQAPRVPEGEWDLACCFEAIEHVPRPDDLLRQAGRLLADRGMLVVSTPDRASTPAFVHGRPRNPFHEHEWYHDEFVALLRRHFHEVEMHVQVESAAAQARVDAVDALRTVLMACNPLVMLALRAWPGRREERAWKRLRGLAAAGIADYPIVPRALAAIHGAPRFHVAVCRRPIRTEATS